MLTSRQVAAEVLIEVLAAGRSLSACLGPRAAALSDRRERALAKQLCFGVLRWLPRLQSVISVLVRKPLRRRDTDVQVLLLLGLYQLIYSRVPVHAAVAETVSLASSLSKPWAKPLANAVLRRFDRERVGVLAQADREPSARHAHPDWLLERIRHDWPLEWRSIVEANNQHAAMTLRVNAREGDAESYLAMLRAACLDGAPNAWLSHGITLSRATEVDALPGFASGLVSVQDAAAQLAAPLLELRSGQRVLDACAGPGGKTALILEQAAGLSEVVAVEKDASQLTRLSQTLQRLRLEATVHCADAVETDSWWDGVPFDRVLIDAPCSATGVIRRHPDIKLHRRGSDIQRLASEQRAIIDALWPLLAPGGVLLYATCSIISEENQLQVTHALKRHRGAVRRPIHADWGTPLAAGRQILPGEQGMDGFYYARLAKDGA